MVQLIILLTVTYQMLGVFAGKMTKEQLERKLPIGVRHVSCQTRVIGFHMQRHCRKQLNTTVRCDLNELERRKVREVAKQCCEDAPSCEPEKLFNEFCCQDGNCETTECEPWDDAVDEINMAELVFSSTDNFNSIQDRVIFTMKEGEIPDYLPEALSIYGKNPELVADNEISIRKYFHSHRLQVGFMAQSLGIISGPKKQKSYR